MFLEAVKDHFINRKEQPAITDEMGNVMSYGELDVFSARVHAYLKQKDIRKEQFILILLPRSVYVPAVMMGIIRAGAAFVVMEEDMPSDRIEYIRKDCGCILTVDRDSLVEIRRTEPLFSWAEADVHDVLTAAYTSGTTGTPKGVVLERGILDLNALSSATVEKTGAFQKGDRLAVNYPLNFIVFTICFGFFYMGGTLQILSNQTSRDIRQYVSYLEKEKPTVVFLIPSLYSIIADMLPDSVRTVFLGGEAARNLNAKGDRYLVSIYSATELGYVCAYAISHGGKKINSLGKPIQEDTLLLLNSEDSYGEIHAKAKYTRGYVGRTEENADRFQNGYFCTGDLGILNEEGEIICCGRADEMLKINGNRVEPEETAAVFRSITGIKEACAKGFSDGDHPLLCLYYEGDELQDRESILAAMKEKLPYYSLPSHMIRMEKLPRVRSGKVDRSRLNRPDSNLIQKEYLKPSDALEESICRAFSKVFGLERVGVLDDFLTLGGTSLMTFEIEMELEELPFSAYDLYDCSSILEVAERIRERTSDEGREALDSYPLSAGQEYYLYWQMKMPESTMYNLPLMLRFDSKRYDAEKLAAAMEKTIKAHPSFRSRIYEENGTYRQKLCVEREEKITVQKLTEQELEEKIDHLITPFDLMEKPLYRWEIFETEEAIYLFFDVSHLIFDGSSFKLLLEDFSRAYAGQTPVGRDQYESYLASMENVRRTEHYQKSYRYFAEKYGMEGWEYFPKKDYDGKERSPGVVAKSLSEWKEEIEEFKKEHNVTSNALFIFLTLFTLSVFNEEEDSFLNWLFDCRMSAKWMKTIGLFNVELPVCVNFGRENSVKEILTSVEKQIEDGISHSDYSWSYTVPKESVSFIYQKDIYHSNVTGDNGVEPVELPDPRRVASNDFDIEVFDDLMGLSLVLSYDTSAYREESVNRFGQIYCSLLNSLVRMDMLEGKTVGDMTDRLNKNLH